jgi:hypothetical protein
MDSIGHLIFKDDPFTHLPGNYQVIPFLEGTSAQAIVDQVCADNRWLVNYIQVQIGGEIVPKEFWHLVKLKKNAPVTLLVIPQGGGVGEVLKTVAMVAVMATVAYFTMGAGNAAFAGFMGGMGVTGVGFAIAGAAVMLGATLMTSMALNALFPPPRIDAPSLSIGAAQGNQDPQTYQFSLDTNTSWQYKPVPRVYGRVKMAPNYAARPFIDSIGDQQYLYLLFDFGYGPLKLEDLRIGENPLSTYQGVEYKIHQSFKKGDQLSIYNKDVWQDPYSQKITQTDWRTATTQPASNQSVIDFQFSQGLVKVNSTTGDQEDWTADLQVQWRAVGDANWSGFGATGYQITGDHTVLSADTLRVTRRTNRPFTISLRLDFPRSGEYEMRVLRANEDSQDRYTQDDVYLTSVRSIKNVTPIAPEVPHTIVEMKILASDQINGSVNNFTAIATSMLNTNVGGETVIASTRNPAWIYLDVLMGTGAVRPAAESKIDMAAFNEWAKWCDKPAANAPDLPRCQCDLIISGEYTAWQVLKLISGTGDATPSMRSGKYSISIDRPKTTPVQMFTPRNASDFSSVRSYHIQPHALRVQYIDPNQEWQQREILVFDDGRNESNSTIFEILELTGVTNYHQAYRIGRHTLAQGRLRQETFTIKVGVENLLAARGDKVTLSYDIPKIGSGWARIKRIDGNKVILDAPFSAISNLDYLRVRTIEGQVDYDIVEIFGDDTALVSGYISKLEPGQLVTYGEKSKLTMDCLIKSVQPGPDLTANIEMVPYAEGIYDSEVDVIPPYDPLITDINDMRPGAVLNLQATQLDTVVNRYHYISVALSWRPAVGIAATRYSIYQFIDGKWVFLDRTKDLTYYAYKDVKVINEDGSKVGLIGKEMTFAVVGENNTTSKFLSPARASRATITPYGDIGRPDAPPYFDLDMRTSQQITLDWRHPKNNDIDHYVIRYSPIFKGADVSDSTIVVQKVAYPATSVTVPARLGTYFIKTVDTTGNASRLAAEAITPTEILNNDVDIQTVEDLTWDGVKDGLLTDAENLILTEGMLKGTYYFDNAISLAAIYPVHFVSEIHAAASSSTLEVVDDHLWDAYIEFRTGTDMQALDTWPILDEVQPDLMAWSGDFGPWRKFLSGDYTIRATQFRLVIESAPGIEVKVSDAIIKVTSPVRVAMDYDIVAPTAGKQIIFSPAFQETPSVGITSDTFREGDSYQITDKTRTGFTIQFKNGSTGVERQFDWIARGHGTEVSSIPSGNF